MSPQLNVTGRDESARKRPSVRAGWLHGHREPVFRRTAAALTTSSLGHDQRRRRPRNGKMAAAIGVAVATALTIAGCSSANGRAQAQGGTPPTSAAATGVARSESSATANTGDAAGNLANPDAVLLEGTGVNAGACLNADSCLVVASDGLDAWTTDARSPHPKWTSATEFGNTSPTSLACPTVNLCVAGDYSGGVDYSTHPLQSMQNWSKVTLDTNMDPNLGSGSNQIYDVSCGSQTYCVAVAEDGNSYVSTDPAAGSWQPAGTVQPSDPGDPVSVSCAGTTCLAINGAGYSFLRNGTWFGPSTTTQTSAAGGACITPSACLLYSYNSNTNVGGLDLLDPSSPQSAPTFRSTSTEGLQSCPTNDLCAGIGTSVINKPVVIYSTDPTSNQPTWKQKPVFANAHGISCSPQLTCVVTANGDDAAATGVL